MFHEPDGAQVVADPAARWALRVPAEVRADPPPVEETMFLQGLVEEARRPALVRFTLHVALETIYQSAEVRDGVDYLLGSLAPRGRVRLLVYFTAPPPTWSPAALWLADLAERHPGPEAWFALEGPFGSIPEPDMRLLYQSGCRLGVVAGWPAGLQGWQPDSLRELARFGFRVPLICYVDADNIAAIPGWIEEACEANEHSGFSLPLVFHHPAYSFLTGQPAPPEAEAYAALLVTAYRNYPHYDEVFQPVAELVESVAQGGWCRVRRSPTDIRLSVTPDGVGVFRQVPARARPWAGWDQILTTDPALLGPDLLAAATRLFAWEDNAFCRTCTWRFVCGGIDAWPGGSEAPTNALRTGCEYRKLFLPQLIAEKGQRTADILALLDPAS